jgi:hypothetical protein
MTDAPTPTTAPDPVPSPDAPRVSARDTAVLVCLAGTSGAAVVAHAFDWVPMRYSSVLVVLPSFILIAAFVLLRQGRSAAVHVLAERVMYGALWGLIATIVYDIVRPPFVVAFDALFDHHTDPFKAMPIFGDNITGRGTDDALSIAVGWAYHFWNGIGFGIMFALVRPHGRWLAGLIWGLGLEAFMLMVYPDFLGARLDNPAFLWTSVFGHGVWGLTLGWGLSWKGPKR